MDFIDLKKRLTDKHWFELTEFEDLQKRGLIARTDSIQTMVQKWLKSDASLNAERTILIKAKKEAENALQEATEGHKKAVEQAKTIQYQFIAFRLDTANVVSDMEETIATAEDTRKDMIKEMDKMRVLLERCEAKNLEDYTIGESLELLVGAIKRIWQK